MLILGMESSSLVASAALLSEEKLIAEFTVNNALTHSQTLMPMIDAVMKSAGKEMNELTAVAISRGPGSFTGLRIGSATAKGIGLALNVPLAEVPTLAALAYNLYGITDRIICPIMDARRSEVYSAAYVFEEVHGGAEASGSAGGTAGADAGKNVLAIKTVLDENAGPVEELTDRLDKIIADGGYKGVIFMGDGVPPYKELIAGRMRSEFSFAPEFLSRQRAAAVAAYGMKMFKQGRVVPADEHVPVYLRVSQAEREAARNTGN